jgi:hypothetical protein
LFIILTMADLNNSEIAAMKAKIEGYDAELASCPANEKAIWAGLISSSRAYLTELVKQQSAPGKPPPSTSLLSSSSHITPSLISSSCSTLTPFCLFSASPSLSSICSTCCHLHW